jgi:hypothetical protein
MLMIDPVSISVLTVVAGVYVATGRTAPCWIADALCMAVRDPSMPADVARQAASVLRDLDQQESCE